MKPKLIVLLASTAALLPLAVAAQEATAEPAAPPSSLSRADVRAELAAAKANGGMAVFRAGYIGSAPSVRARADVQAELKQAQASGEWARLNAEAPELMPQRAVAAPAWLARR
jgi:hypothetical protein